MRFNSGAKVQLFIEICKYFGRKIYFFCVFRKMGYF